jgi:transposase-like protein
MKNNQSSPSDQQKFYLVSNRLGQVREMVEAQMRGALLSMLVKLFTDEVNLLCGPRFSRKNEGILYRGGSDHGSVLAQGRRLQIKKPRVRGDKGEVELHTYAALQNYDMFSQKIMDHMMSGVSTRNYDGLLDEIEGGLGVSKSMVSRAFVNGSKQALETINSRDLSSYRFCSIMIDGIGFGSRTVVAAMGITDKGKKIIIGLREGDTENWEVVRDLLASLTARGLSQNDPLLFVIDGGKALKKAITKVFGKKAFVQRCVRHKERNILQYLPKPYHMEFRRRWKKLHGCADYATAKTEYTALENWLGNINYAALHSLQEAEMETMTVIKIGVPKVLRRSLLSTNPIESAFSRVKSNANRVTNWKTGTDQVSRWAAICLLEAEARFIALPGGAQCGLVIESMKNFFIENQEQFAV